MEQEIRVTEPGTRLDRFLARQFPGYSRTHLQDLIDRGCVRVGGALRSSDYRLQEGEAISVTWPGCGWVDLPFKDWILFEDRDILILNKPAGLLMHPIGESWLKMPEAALFEPEPNLAGLLLSLYPEIVKSGAARCGLVHRLDRQTSGVLVVAKNKAAQDKLVAAFAERRVDKIYRGIVLGDIARSVEVEAPLGRKPGHRRIRVSPWGKTAATSFRVLENGKGATLVEARPLTGRTHQIRAHLAHIHHPILGDPEWPEGSPEKLKALGLPPPPRLMLHAYRLTIPHPRTGKPAQFGAPPPKDFKDYWKQLR